jgi:predicted nucleic acid-binding protein
MMLYLDTSALVKRYIYESGSELVNNLFADARGIATGLISRAETAAAFARAARSGILDREQAWQALQDFRSEWPDYIRLPVTEATVVKGDQLAWELNLRGYDSVHLAMALIWEDTLREEVELVSFDQQLWHAAQESGLKVSPHSLTTS